MQVTCPRCRRLFEADDARDLTCPGCGFRAPAPSKAPPKALELQCPRCGRTIQAHAGALASCPDCGFRDPIPDLRSERLMLACPRCSTEVEGLPGEQVECRSCGYGAEVPEDAPTPDAADDAQQKATAGGPGRVQVACPRCAAELAGTPGEALACACGFEAEVPSPSNQDPQ